MNFLFLKQFTLGSIVFLGMSIALHAQKYSVYTKGLFVYTLPKTKTVYESNQKVKVYPPLDLGIRMGMDRRINNRFFVGIGVSIEHFDFYQEVDAVYGGIIPGGGVTFGFARNSNAYLVLLGVYARIGYVLSLNEKNHFNFIFSPVAGHFLNGGKTIDTAINNSNDRSFLGSDYTDTYDIEHKFKKGLNILANVSVEYERKLGKKQRFAFTASIMYQQGFRYFYEYTGFLGRKGISEGAYTTKVSGTSIQAEVGLKFYFGATQKTKYLNVY